MENLKLACLQQVHKHFARPCLVVCDDIITILFFFFIIIFISLSLYHFPFVWIKSLTQNKWENTCHHGYTMAIDKDYVTARRENKAEKNENVKNSTWHTNAYTYILVYLVCRKTNASETEEKK
jgi:hypothetical protein